MPVNDVAARQRDGHPSVPLEKGRFYKPVYLIGANELVPHKKPDKGQEKERDSGHHLASAAVAYGAAVVPFAT